MKFLTKLSPEFDSIDVEHLESYEISEASDPKEILAIVGILAPILIMVLEIWKKVPGRKQSKRAVCIDKAIAALRIASIFSTVKFKK